MKRSIVHSISSQIKQLIDDARLSAAQELNHRMIQTYWEIGRIIVEHEQGGQEKAPYGAGLLTELAKELTRELGKGFSRANLQNMRNVYLSYPNLPDASGKLTWSHYCELISVPDPDARSFYENECRNAHWSVRELKRQIDSSLFERLLLSDGDANRETVLALAQQGISLQSPRDILKEPYVFEFLGARENKPILERDLEQRLIRHIEDFLLELGRGFMFVGKQRVTLGNQHYYVDMVFYNKILRAYVLIDLKMGAFRAEYAGQMNMYLNYYRTEVNEEGIDNPPIGIILCRSSDEIVAEYALGGLSNQVFASQYVYYIPDKEQLIREVEALLAENDGER